MQVHDVANLVGPFAPGDLASLSVLHRAEPLIVRVDAPVPEAQIAEAATNLRHAPTVTVLVGQPGSVPATLVDAVDVCLSVDDVDPPPPWVHGDPSTIVDAVGARPTAALALAALLRTSQHLGVWDALATEAATYALLQASEAHRTWLERRGPVEPRPTRAPPLHAERHGSQLHLTLDRPDTRNAVDTAMRDALVEAFDLALVDPTIDQVHLRAAGPDFSAGGDLREFGTTTDPATSLAVRLARHPGWAAHQIADRLHVHLHGHCIGAGIEVPAFAGHLTAHPRTTFALPELTLGLVPGAGGTVSLPRRIGRHRTTWLALTGTTLTAASARSWGLVDQLAPSGPDSS